MSVLVRDCADGDVERMAWAASDSLHRAWHHQYERALRGEVDYLVAEIDGEVVGKAVLDWVHEPDGTPWLWMASVDPAYRGRGIGTAMLAEAERRARDRDAQRLELAVDDDNPRAYALYVRCGYVDVAPYVDEYDVTDDAGVVSRVVSPGRRLRKVL